MFPITPISSTAQRPVRKIFYLLHRTLHRAHRPSLVRVHARWHSLTSSCPARLQLRPVLFRRARRALVRGGAAMEGTDNQLFVRDFSSQGQPRREWPRPVGSFRAQSWRTPVVCFAHRPWDGHVVRRERRGSLLLDPKLHESMVESLASQRMPLRASAHRAAAT